MNYFLHLKILWIVLCILCNSLECWLSHRNYSSFVIFPLFCSFFYFVSFYSFAWIVSLETQSSRCSLNPQFWCSFSLQKSQPWNSRWRLDLYSVRWERYVNVFFFGDHHRQHSPPAAEITGFLLPGHGACITHADPSLRWLFFSCLFKEKEGKAFKTSNLLLSSSTPSPCEMFKKLRQWKKKIPSFHTDSGLRDSVVTVIPGGRVFHYIGIEAKCHLSSQASGALVRLRLRQAALVLSLCLAGDTCSSLHWWHPSVELFSSTFTCTSILKHYGCASGYM